MIYTLPNIRSHKNQAQMLGILTKNLKKLMLTKIRLHSTCTKRKKCHDIRMSRQEGSTMRHLASAQYWIGLAGGNTGRLFPTFGGLSVPTGLAIGHWIGCINAIKT